VPRFFELAAEGFDCSLEELADVSLASVDALRLVDDFLNLSSALRVERARIDEAPLVPLLERSLTLFDHLLEFLFGRTRRFVVLDGLHDERVHVDVVEDAQHVRRVPELGANLLDLGLEHLEDLALASIIEEEVPDLDLLLLLSVAVDAPDPLFEPVRVPGQFVVRHDVAAVLEIDPSLAASVANRSRDCPWLNSSSIRVRSSLSTSP